ncbi:MAG: primosomal protein N' [Bacteroidetes bacterium]|jgi:primosomal protein N' (replication factor Y)|nr:primosomal protein N' [Bacteroidota bacterium]
MEHHRYFADIILPLPLQDTFTYFLTKEQFNQAQAGMRVTIQFGKRKLYTGIILRLHHEKPEGFDIKPVIDLLDENPIATVKQLQLWVWIRDYYLCTLGEVYKAATPSGLKIESETQVFSNPEFDDVGFLTEKEKRAYGYIQSQGSLSLQELSKNFEGKTIQHLVYGLQSKKAIFLGEQVKNHYAAKTVNVVKVHPDYDHEFKMLAVMDELGKAPKQQQVLMAFIELTGMSGEKPVKEVFQADLLKKANAGQQALKALEKKGVLRVEKKKISRLDRTEPLDDTRKPLTDNQQTAIEKIRQYFNSQKTVLLHGVTSSGKTEIYIQLIREVIDSGEQALYILPEIALTTQIMNRLHGVFGNKVGVYHSRFSDNERVEVWQKMIDPDKAYQVILGVRSAVFLPFHQLGLVIVDEEHESTIKQFDPAPRYHARDTAIVLAGYFNARILLGTATPSLDSYYNAQTGKYGLVELNERYGNVQLPEIKIIDVRSAYRQKTMRAHFSPLLLAKMQETIAAGKQIILFQNRRGFSPYIQCQTCGWIPQCPYCDVSLTYHKMLGHLNCHYCGYAQPMPNHCGACNNTTITTKGFGTEKIEEDLSLLLPEANIQRLDLDSTRSKKSFERIIGDFEAGFTNVLVGTQMITKGLDFDNVRLVGILNADNMLSFPDYRAYERSFQLMAQVSGRAGRKEERGLVIIQTSDPKNQILKDVLNNNYKNMYLHQAMERKQFGYPPYCRLIKIVLKHKQKPKVGEGADRLAKAMQKLIGNRVVGPVFPVITRVQSYYIKHIYLKIEKEKSVSQVKKWLRQEIGNIMTYDDLKGIRVYADVDPN